MKLYSFVNSYLSSIQKGIQTAHMIARMGQRYYDNNIYRNWVDNHQTIIILDGGDDNNLQRIKVRAYKEDGIYEWFNEPALNDLLTSVGILVPEPLYEGIVYDDIRDEIVKGKLAI